MLAHLRELVTATDVPVNADFEGGYADAPEEVAENVRRCVETGVAGLSIEDSTTDAANPLYDFELALARVRAARAAIDAAGGEVVFTARSEGFIRGRPDLDETIRRLRAFAAAGADCLYAPGIRTREQIEAVVKAVAPKPVNLLVSTRRPHGGGDRRDGRAPHQRRRLARARGLERADEVGARNCRSRAVRQLRRRRAECGAQRLLPRRCQGAGLMEAACEPDPVTGQPVGLPVDTTPAQRPGPVTLEGRYGRVERLAMRHAEDLWQAYAGHDSIWTYLSSYGPFADFAAFSDWLVGRVRLDDPYSYAIVDLRPAARSASRR